MRNLFFVYLFKWFVCQCHFLYKKYVSHILCEQIVRLMFRMFSMNFKNNEKWNEKWNIHISLFTLFWIVPSRTHVSKHTHRVKREICICNCLLYVYLLLICFTLHWSLSFLCIWFCHPLVFQRPKSGAAVLAPHGALRFNNKYSFVLKAEARTALSPSLSLSLSLCLCCHRTRTPPCNPAPLILFYSLLDPALSIVAVLSPRPPIPPRFFHSLCSRPLENKQNQKDKTTFRD